MHPVWKKPGGKTPEVCVEWICQCGETVIDPKAHRAEYA